MQEAIILAKQIDEQNKAAEFYQEALGHVARQGYGTANFEEGGEEALDIVDEFYSDESKKNTVGKQTTCNLFRIFRKDYRSRLDLKLNCRN